MNTKVNKNSVLNRIAAVFMIVMLMLAAMPVTSAYAAVSTPTFTNFAGTTGPITITPAQFACAAGANRLLVAVVTAEYNANPEVMTLTVTKGVAFTQAVKTTGNTRTGIWIGYLNDAQITANAASNLTVTEPAGGDAWWSVNVHLTCLTGVNQTTPIVAGGTAFNSSDNNTATWAFNNVPAVNTGLMIYAAGHNASNGFTAPTGYTESVDLAGASHRTTAGYKVVTATGNESGTITFNANDRYAAAVISVNPAAVTPVAPAITSANAATFNIGSANTFTVTATGNPAPTFSFTGVLPTGVTLTAAGVLSGTPAAGTAGTYPLVITASNGTLPNATQNFTLTVQAAPEMNIQGNGINIVDGDTSLIQANGTDFGLVAQGVSAYSTFTIQNTGTGNLTLGSIFITGTEAADFTVTTPPTSPVLPGGSTTFVVRFIPAAAGAAQRSALISIINNDTNETPYDFSVRGFRSAGIAEIAIQYAGVGIIDGDTTPSTIDGTDFGSVIVGANNTLTYTIRNLGDQNLTLGAITIGGAQAANFTVFSAPTSPVPPGGSTTFQLRFIPSAVGARNATFSIVNNDTGNGENPYNFNILGTGVAPTAPTITSAAPAGGTEGIAYTHTYTATGTGTITYSVTTGALPTGLTLTTAGVLSGTPTVPGTYTGTVTATNGVAPNATQNFSIVIAGVPPTITSAAPLSGIDGVAYNHVYTATGTAPVTFSVTAGALPTGLTLTSAGVLSGTPSVPGTYTGTVSATNGFAPNAAQNFSIVIASVPPTITSAAPVNGAQGLAYSHTYTATGTAPITFSVTTGSLPTGLTLSSAGVISGTPTALGTFAGVVTATNGVLPDATQNFSITINDAPIITSANSTNFTLGTAGAFTVTATGSPIPTLSMTGTLPTGVTFTAATGILAGTPAAGTSGTYPLTFTASNGTLPDAVQNFTLTVSQGPSITSANTVTFSVGSADTFTVTASGVPAPTLSMTGTLPSGVTFIPATGILSGTPAVGSAGTYPLTFNAANGILPNASQSFTLIVKNGPTIAPSGIGSVPDTGNGSITNNEKILDTLKITKLIVKFDHDVYNVPSGNANFAKSVVNPANYMLVMGSASGSFQTVSCVAGVQSPDVTITVDSVTYTNGGGAGPFVATLSINGGFPLNAIGYYRLFVCGTTSIVDAADINLELAGNGITPGTDFLLNFRIRSAEIGADGTGNGTDTSGGAGGFTPSSSTLIPVTGFAPNQVTKLPAQPANKAYKPMNEIRIEIPTLGINYPIVGVRLDKNSWDLTWLKDSVAYLEGSAYPTLAGNTVLTAHVVDANNNLGPFSDIKGMKSGQKIYIHAYGQVYVYQVQENMRLLPISTSTVFKHEDYDWITLVTCENFNAKTGEYDYRRMVRAVLVSVVPEKR